MAVQILVYSLVDDAPDTASLLSPYSKNSGAGCLWHPHYGTMRVIWQDQTAPAAQDVCGQSQPPYPQNETDDLS